MTHIEQVILSTLKTLLAATLEANSFSAEAEDKLVAAIAIIESVVHDEVEKREPRQASPKGAD
jgi:hypothetical protein